MDAHFSLLPNVLKHGFYSRRFYNRCLSGQERLDLEFLVYRPSSIVQLFVPLRFAIFFTQKYSALNQLMEHLVPLTYEQWAKLVPLIPPHKHTATRGRPPIDERLVLDELKDLASRVALFIFTVHMHVEPAHAAL